MDASWRGSGKDSVGAQVIAGAPQRRFGARALENGRRARIASMPPELPERER
jgi:hypothetical protein